MKKITLLLFIISTALFANELKSLNSYKDAINIAKSQNKLVILMTSIDSCPVCGYMKDIVFEREKVLEYLNKNFVVVIKNVERDRYPKRFHTRDMPTFYFIDPDGEKEVSKPYVGGAKPEKFLNILRVAVGEEIVDETTKEDEDGYYEEYCVEDEEE